MSQNKLPSRYMSSVDVRSPGAGTNSHGRVLEPPNIAARLSHRYLGRLLRSLPLCCCPDWPGGRPRQADAATSHTPQASSVPTPMKEGSGSYLGRLKQSWAAGQNPSCHSVVGESGRWCGVFSFVGGSWSHRLGCHSLAPPIMRSSGAPSQNRRQPTLDIAAEPA